MKITTIVGARPQFIKAAALSRVIAEHQGFEEQIIHTGQHYDEKMSQNFFDELCIPEPSVNLGIGSGLHGQQTGKMLAAIEEQLLQDRPDVLLVYGDTNSTLAGALAAAKLHIPVAHVEAGLRSFNRQMPEETNRVMTDHLSTYLFTPSAIAVQNLAKEGICEGVVTSGDIMYDAFIFYQKLAAKRSQITNTLKLDDKVPLILATIHRAENTDQPERLNEIISALRELHCQGRRVILPVHPRTRKILTQQNFDTQGIEMIDPISYFDMLQLLNQAQAVITDSGGLQKEAFWAKVPCITVRDQSEWLETINEGWNQLTGANAQSIIKAIAPAAPAAPPSAVYGEGNCAQRILQELTR